MKIIHFNLLFIALITLAMGCSSASKKATSSPTANNAPAVQAAAPVTSAATKTKRKKSSKEGLKADTLTAALDCQLNAEHRKLEIKPNGQGCDLIYTKLGQTKTVASSASGNNHCEKSMAGIKKKLEAASFVCQ